VVQHGAKLGEAMPHKRRRTVSGSVGEGGRIDSQHAGSPDGTDALDQAFLAIEQERSIQEDGSQSDMTAREDGDPRPLNFG